jgi:transposase
MSGTPIAMNKLRKVIALYSAGKSKSYISSCLHLSRNTVKKYIDQFISLRLTLDEINDANDGELEKLFIYSTPVELSSSHKDLHSFFPYAEKELKRPGVTKMVLWKEYKIKYPDGLQSTQFCEHFNRWLKQGTVTPLMHMVHKAGDKMFIDYAGKTLSIVDPATGELEQVQFFVAILGASQLTYAEASYSQKKVDFITSVENALHYYGGVPKAIVPDNLKSAVTKSSRYEPTINETFLDFSNHYNTVILPARSRKPRDKSLVEGAVKILYTRIYSPLRNQVFSSLEDLNKAIWIELEKHNNTKFSKRNHTRHDLFEELETHTLDLLPQERFEIKKQSIVTVIMNGHVLLSEDKHYYSVPYAYIRKKVKILYTSKSVEIFYRYTRIAVHKRVKSPFNYTTITEHLASEHQFMTDWTPQRFINWGASIHEHIELLIIKILEKKKHPEQAYKSCMGILSLEKKVGSQRLINACQRALDYELYNYKTVLNILEKGLDKIEPENNNQELPTHKNIRGKNYYN